MGLIASEREANRIHMARRGIDVSSAAWVIPDTSESRPWMLPMSLDLSTLSKEEVKVGMSLGMLTFELLTDAQHETYLDLLDEDVPEGTADGLLTKVLDAAVIDAERLTRWRRRWAIWSRRRG